MAQSTYNARVLVLRKTKLGESDLILSLLAQDGSQIRAVAKGARKPTSQFSSRLELYSQADVLLAQGRSLDIVKELGKNQMSTAQFYKDNVELVKNYQRIANDLSDLIVSNVSVLQRLAGLIENNMSCPAVREAAHGKK